MINEVRREQYFAVSKNGALSHIKEAYESDEDYYCPNCGCRMLKRCGKIRVWHFAHDWRVADEEQRKCSYETYLHGYAKLRIKQWFDESNSIIIQYQKKCKCKLSDNCNMVQHEGHCEKNIKELFDLKKCLDICYVEKEIKLNGSLYRPDLLWQDSSNPNNYIFIEIKVTHECTEQKKISGARIIEFEIHSEDDIEKIITHNLKENDFIKFYGFKFKNECSDKIKPLYRLKKFRLYNSGKVHIDTRWCTCQNYLKRLTSSIFEITIDKDNIPENQFYLYGIIAAIDNGFSIKNCCICNYRTYIKDKDSFLCSKKDIEIENNNEATNCNYFKLDSDYRKRYNRLENLSKHYSIVDIWSNLPNRIIK